MILRFIGTEAEVHNTGLTMFGQSVDVPDAEAKAAIAGNLPALPESDFTACGFTKEELEQCRFPAGRVNCSKEFSGKWQAARERLHELRESYRAERAGVPTEKPAHGKPPLKIHQEKPEVK